MSDYYDFGKLLSHNGVFNMVVGARGVGKTYGAKLMVMKNAIKKGEEFVYLRRYKTEMRTTQTFFADVAHEYPRHNFRVNGGEAQYKEKGAKKWVTFGYFVALSTAQKMKSVSYPKVTRIIYDEFIIEKGYVRYLPSEVDALLSFYSTVDRWQDRTRVLMLANAVSIDNPYFIKWNIEPCGKEFVTRGDDFVVCQFVNSADFSSRVRETRFGRFLESMDPVGAAYSIDNRFADYTNVWVDDKPAGATPVIILRLPEGSLSIWTYKDLWYAQKRLPRTELPRLAFDHDDLREGEVQVSYSDKIMVMLRTQFRHGRMRFDSPQTRALLKGIFLK